VTDLQEQFVTEARELIRQATDDLIALERQGASAERIDGVFRAFHTLKGSAGMVELPAMSMTLHAAEDLLAGIRNGTLELGTEIVDAALACLDQVSRWVDDFENAGALPSRAGGDARAMAARLRSPLPGSTVRRPLLPVPGSRTSESSSPLPEWVLRLIAGERFALASRMRQAPSAATAICYQPIPGCFYMGDDPLQLMRQIPELLTFRVEPCGPIPPLAELDPYACNLRLQALSAGDPEEIAGIFRLVPDQVEIIRIPPQGLDAAAPGKPDDHTLIKAIIEAQRELLRVPGTAADFAGRAGAAARVAENALRYGQQPHVADEVKRAGALALAKGHAGPLLSALEQALIAAADMPSTETAPGNRQSGATTAGPSTRAVDRVLRVGEAKIDSLVNLAGELVVARNALLYSTGQVERTLGGGELVMSIQRDRDTIDRLVSDLHGTILQLRLVPIAQLFGSFPRLIRDLARQLNKNVVLTTRGETTEVDKTILDRLFEPMVHLVRNACDHGIEDREQRRSAGKSEVATISIAASRVGDRLVLEIADDGRGIDPIMVRRKAAEKRLLPTEELADLTDQAVVDLVFSPGFSTASAVSDISGRGIGMDVVRTAIEQIGGRVSLKSQVGAGTAVRLDLPTTIAMSRIMVVEAGGQLFGIAMDVVSETLRIAPQQVSRIKQNDGFVLHDRVIPIISLAELMSLPRQPQDAAAARLLVVVEAAERIAAFEIDAIRDRLDVVLKPMHGLLAGARFYAGTTLLGNGKVLLVLDVKEILP
jgi:two-component system chemotaxis sensor kinase CheA